MKEFKIAKENVKRFDKEKGEIDIDYDTNLIHKQTCQRWLEFLEKLNKQMQRVWKAINMLEDDEVTEKITDLKQAIKLYEDNGI